MYSPILAREDTHYPQEMSLPYEQARDFNEDLFAQDDLPHNPKPLLVEILHKYVLMAAGQPAEPIPSFKPAYRILLVLPFLRQGDTFIHWLAENLTMAKSQFDVDIDLHILLFSEACIVRLGER